MEKNSDWKKVKIIERYERKGEFGIAAYLCDQSGLFDRAIDNYLRNKNFGDFESAHHIAKVSSPKRTIEICDKAIEYYNKDDYDYNKEHVAEWLERKGEKEESFKLYVKLIEEKEKTNFDIMAGNLCVKAKLYDRAIENYEKAGSCGEAIKIAKKIGDNDKVKQLYDGLIDSWLNGGKYERALKIATEDNRYDRLEEICEKGLQKCKENNYFGLLYKILTKTKNSSLIEDGLVWVINHYETENQWRSDEKEIPNWLPLIDNDLSKSIEDFAKTDLKKIIDVATCPTTVYTTREEGWGTDYDTYYTTYFDTKDSELNVRMVGLSGTYLLTKESIKKRTKNKIIKNMTKILEYMNKPKCVIR
jgi:tetratricopeptide (TPR) repeat protein